jgi:dinuclear metal center YbgI/SA1388 family protein
MQLQRIVQWLENWAPPSLQASFDNAGLLLGDRQQEIRGILTSLDCTESVVEEAVEKGCNLVVAHHPLVFRPLKSLAGTDYVSRTLRRALKHEIAIYAAHTNLDQLPDGVNAKLSEALGLEKTRILRARRGILRKLICYVPETTLDDGRPAVEAVRQALFEAGAGHIGAYDQCSFGAAGTGTYRPLEGADPFQGRVGARESAQEFALEVIYPDYREGAILSAMEQAHPYEEVAHDIIALENAHAQVGYGMLGQLAEPMLENDFLAQVKERLHVPVLRHTPLRSQTVQRVAVCGGAGLFLLPEAVAAQADAFITADVKYHDFFEVDGRLLLIDPGHYETEQYTKALLREKLETAFPNFAIYSSERNTNPVNYF